MTSSISQISTIPVAFIGTGYFLTLLVLALRLQKTPFYKSVFKALVWSGFSISCLLIAIQLLILKSLCLFCLTSLGLVTILMWATSHFKFQKTQIFSKPFVILLAIIMVTFWIPIGVLISIDHNYIPTEIRPNLTTLPKIRPEPQHLGHPKAKNTLTIFSSSNCPKCQYIDQVIKSLLKHHPDQFNAEIYTITTHSKFADKLGIKVTPTFYLNGQWVAKLPLKILSNKP